MAHISSIAAAIYTDLSVATGTNVTPGTAAATTYPIDEAGLKALFTTATSSPKYLRLRNVRSFPAVGSPANIVKVPVYGQKTSQTVSGQSDAPSLEVTVNYVATDWAKGATATTFASGDVNVMGSEFANMVGDGVKRVWRLALMAAPVGSGTTQTPGITQGLYDSNAGGLGSTQNTQFYFHGKLESLLITPSLTDGTTATLSFSIQSDFYGAYTI
jgi:hypothetical protein